MKNKEKLEEAKRLYESANADQKYVLESLFPELKESEDERIRKAILELVRQSSEVLDRQNQNNMIAWLEKQEGCEYIKKDWLEHIKQSWYKEGFIDGKYSGEKQGEKKHTDNDMVEALRTEYEKGRADVIVEMQKEWSEEDEEFLRRAINAAKDKYPMTANWLKSLKDKVQPQPKQEWSEEDEDYYDAIIAKLEVTQEDAALTDNQMNFLKSLKGRYTWKPSDEQMEALHDLNLTGNISYAGQGQVLIEFYNDLKKLKGE